MNEQNHTRQQLEQIIPLLETSRFDISVGSIVTGLLIDRESGTIAVPFIGAFDVVDDQDATFIVKDAPIINVKISPVTKQPVLTATNMGTDGESRSAIIDVDRAAFVPHPEPINS